MGPVLTDVNERDISILSYCVLIIQCIACHQEIDISEDSQVPGGAWMIEGTENDCLVFLFIVYYRYYKLLQMYFMTLPIYQT